jgi:hypothetical protein
MKVIDISDPMGWSLWKKLAALMALLLMVGVFLNWGTLEVDVDIGNVHTVTTQNGIDWTEGPTIVLSGLFAAFFLITGYPMSLYKDGKHIRMNELLAGLMGFLAFVNAAKIYAEHAESVEKLNETTAYSTVTYTIGAGVYLIVAASFLLMIFSFLLWREKCAPPAVKEAHLAEAETVEAVAEAETVEAVAEAETVEAVAETETVEAVAETEADATKPGKKSTE